MTGITWIGTLTGHAGVITAAILATQSHSRRSRALYRAAWAAFTLTLTAWAATLALILTEHLR